MTLYRKSARVNGRLDPTSCAGQGVIAEHVVYTVLGDCVNCNIPYGNQPYDLISEKYGNINVKSAKPFKRRWKFRANANMPDHYFFIGFDESKESILHVWIFPGDVDLFVGEELRISRIKLKDMAIYEVDPTPYDNVYRDLEICELPEFRNHGQEKDESETAMLRICVRIPKEQYVWACGEYETISEAVRCGLDQLQNANMCTQQADKNFQVALDLLGQQLTEKDNQIRELLAGRRSRLIDK